MVRHVANREPACVEGPRGPDAFEPRSAVDERRFVHVPGEDHVGTEISDPRTKILIAVLTPSSEGSRRTGRRWVVHPDPARRTVAGLLPQLRVNVVARRRTVPPWTHRHSYAI